MGKGKEENGNRKSESGNRDKGVQIGDVHRLPIANFRFPDWAGQVRAVWR